jgi:hypothetical protein
LRLIRKLYELSGLDFIEAKGKEIAEALAMLRQQN